MDEVLAFLKEAHTYFIATINDGKPEVRPFGTIAQFEDRLYIQTGRVKDVCKQILADPAIAICAFDGKGTWLRINATAVADERVEANEAMLDDYPSLRGRYEANDGNCIVFYLKNATATFASFTEAPRTVSF